MAHEDKDDVTFLPYAPMGTSSVRVVTDKPSEKISKDDPRYTVYKTYELFLRDITRLYWMATTKTPTAAGETLFEWEAPSPCYVTIISAGGTTSDAKHIYIDGVSYIRLNHPQNTSIKFQPSSGRPFLFRLKKGDKIKVVMDIAAAGNHSGGLLGFYEDESIHL